MHALFIAAKYDIFEGVRKVKCDKIQVFIKLLCLAYSSEVEEKSANSSSDESSRHSSNSTLNGFSITETIQLVKFINNLCLLYESHVINMICWDSV